jgi:hypothetical protein
LPDYRSRAPSRSTGHPTLQVAVVWTSLALLVVWMLGGRFTFGDDLQAYWSAWQGPGLYEPGAKVGDLTFLYSPAFAQLTWPLGALPFALVRVLWGVAAVLAFAWIAWPLALPVRIGAIGIGVCSAVVGNLDWVIALVLALSIRWPGAWAMVAMTRITVVVAMLGLVASKRWRDLIIAGVTVTTIAALSFAVAPHLWFEWSAILARSAAAPEDGLWMVIAMPPLWARLIAAALIASLARRWPAAIVVAAVVGSPDIWPWTAAILLACVRFVAAPLAVAEPVPSVAWVRLSSLPASIVGRAAAARRARGGG